MKKLFVTLFLLTVAITAQAQEDLVRIGIIKAVDRGALLYMGKLADKYGFRTSYSYYPTPEDAAKAVAKGDVDLAAPGLSTAVMVRNQGKPIVIISGFSKWGVSIVARKDLGLTSFAQLKGRKVGVIKGSSTYLAFLGLLDKNNLSYSEQPGKDVQIVYGKSYPALAAALLTKNVDAASLPDPYGTQAVFRGYANKIGQSDDSPLGQPIRPLITTEKFYTENQAMLVRVLKCLTESSKIFQTQPDVAADFVTKTMFGGFLTVKEYRDMAANGSFTSDITVEHIQTTIDMMDKWGMIDLDPKNPLKAASFAKLDLLKKSKQTK